ncbi:DUF7262 family protein [Halosegnis marinus]|uniref:Uncharacterized protein n=1 Tax=Halosegnis marinus TaxID=3034023 RepID=A0ABD5ZMJ0_9EURY|nr:hypothetical protein [Halosegnis sp. DT85]
MGERAQLPLSLVEAAVGVVLVLAVASGFALGVASPGSSAAQLDAYADDTATVLAAEPPRHGGTTRLAEVARSEAGFERERAALDRRVDRILPDNLMYRVETPHGAVGYPVPAGAPVGERSVATGYGRVTVRVWYA